jgi:hypothetical protein
VQSRHTTRSQTIRDIRPNFDRDFDRHLFHGANGRVIVDSANGLSLRNVSGEKGKFTRNDSNILNFLC